MGRRKIQSGVHRNPYFSSSEMLAIYLLDNNKETSVKLILYVHDLVKGIQKFDI